LTSLKAGTKKTTPSNYFGLFKVSLKEIAPPKLPPIKNFFGFLENFYAI
jgi:hypothetical protein